MPSDFVCQSLGRCLILLLWLLPALSASGGTFFQGPVTGSIRVDDPADAADAVAYLRCYGGFIHGDIRTDAEETHVDAEGRFRFLGSFSLPVTERCHVEVRHPRYLTARVPLRDEFAQTLPPLKLDSWQSFLAAGPGMDSLSHSSRQPWPQAEVRRHVIDTLTWLQSFSAGERRQLARYVPDLHDIYRAASRHGGAEWSLNNVPDIVNGIGRIEEVSGYAYPFRDYIGLVKAGDAPGVRAFLEGGVLREAWERGQAMYTAAANGHVAVVDVLLAAGEPLDAPGCRAPLLAALDKGRWTMALKLIRLGVDPQAACPGKPGLGDVLTTFAMAGDLELLTSFTEAGVSVDIPTRRGTTALADAVSAGRIETVKALLALGADPDVRTADGVALLDAAVAKGHLDIERALRARPGLIGVPVADESAAGEPVALPWRRQLPVDFRVHGHFGDIHVMAADPLEPGLLWLGTSGGLMRIKPETGERRVWTRVDGLPASTVGRLWFDGRGQYLWLATQGGLARLPLETRDGIETVGDREPNLSYASGFLGARDDGSVWYWSDNHVYEMHVEAGEAVRYSPDGNVFGMAAIPDAKGFYLANGSQVWRYEPRRDERLLILGPEAFARLSVVGPDGAPDLRGLALDEAGRHLWISTFRHGIFRFALDSGVISQTRLDAEQRDRCARSTVNHHMHGQVVLAGGAVYAQLERCFGRIDGDNRFTVLEDRILAGPVADAGGDLWYVSAAGFQRIAANGDTRRFPLPPDPIGGSRVTALFAAHGRLFIGVDDAPLVVLDLQRRTLTPIDAVTDVQRLRRVAGRDALLALGKTRYWWIDQHSLASEPLVLRPPGTRQFRPSVWRDVRDIEYDGKAFWVLRDDRSRGIKSRPGLFRLTTQGVSHYATAGNYALGKLVGVAQDPGQPDRLWLVTARNPRLVDFDKTLATSERLGKRSVPRRSVDRSPAFPANSRLCGLALKRNQACDPDVTGLVWEATGSGLLLKRGNSVLRRWPAALPSGTVAVTREPDTTVWIASREGLIEYPVPERLDELLRVAEPRNAETGSRRRTR